jgi:hypothetical protein
MIGEVRAHFEGFVVAPNVVSPIGIYLLLREKEVLYVGKSRNVYNRLAQHYMSKKRGRVLRSAALRGDKGVGVPIPFTHVLVRFCPPTLLDELEARYINEFKPEFNTVIPVRREKVDIDLEAMAEATGLDYRKTLSPAAVWEQSRRSRAPTWRRAEQQFKQDRDRRIKPTMPKMRFMEDG